MMLNSANTIFKKVSILLFILITWYGCKEQTTKELKNEASLPFYNDASFTPEWILSSSSKYATIHTIPTFQFINQLGDTITEQAFQNKIYVANFFFTSCPGICKKLSNNLLAVQSAFKTDGNIGIISHSVTPEKDSITVLQRYAKQYGIVAEKWHLVTGNRTEIYKLARQGYFADEDLGIQTNENDFLHTENVILVDTKKRIRGIYKGTSEIEIMNLIEDIKLLKKEK